MRGASRVDCKKAPVCNFFHTGNDTIRGFSGLPDETFYGRLRFGALLNESCLFVDQFDYVGEAPDAGSNSGHLRGDPRAGGLGATSRRAACGIGRASSC